MSVVMTLQVAGDPKAVEQFDADNTEKAQGILDDMATSLGEAVKEIRVMSYLMKPPSLRRDGLESTARRYVQGFGIRTGLDSGFCSEGPIDQASPMIQDRVKAIPVTAGAVARGRRAPEASTVMGSSLVNDINFKLYVLTNRRKPK